MARHDHADPPSRVVDRRARLRWSILRHARQGSTRGSRAMNVPDVQKPICRDPGCVVVAVDPSFPRSPSPAVVRSTSYTSRAPCCLGCLRTFRTPLRRLQAPRKEGDDSPRCVHCRVVRGTLHPAFNFRWYTLSTISPVESAVALRQSHTVARNTGCYEQAPLVTCTSRDVVHVNPCVVHCSLTH